MNDFELTYYLDGEVFKSTMLVKGSRILPRKAPEKEGYTFSGWSEIPAVMPAEKVDVYGTYRVNEYTLTYIVDGKELRSVKMKYGETITPIEQPELPGRISKGWKDLPETMPASDVTATAEYEGLPFTLTFVVDGEVYKQVTVPAGEIPETPDAPEMTGCYFNGWENLPKLMPAEDVTVQAIYTACTYSLTYLIGGKAVKTEHYAYGDHISPYIPSEQEGYTFLGWGGIPMTMPAEDVQVEAAYQVNTYRVTYSVNGEEYLTDTYTYGAPFVPAEPLTKEGYTFIGWNGVPATVPAHDLKLTGELTVNSYRLTYRVDGVEVSSELVQYGEAVEKRPDPEKEGYTFSGWSEIPETMPSHDVTVDGTFTVNCYPAVFLVEDTVVLETSFCYGETVRYPETPVKEGYSFSGWYGGETQMPARSLTVTGSFSINTYVVTYIADGETIHTDYVRYGDAITPFKAPIRTGYTFSGWGGIQETMPASDLFFSGTYRPNSYELVYAVDGLEYNAVNLEFGTPIEPLACPEKEGYTFSGWSEVPETMPAHDRMVAGEFTRNAYELTYTVDGVPVLSKTVLYGDPIEEVEEPVKEGYTFSGWSTTLSHMPAEDVLVTGTFSVNTYQVVYTVDGEAYKTVLADYGTALSPIDAPEKEGYAFSGWSELPETMPASDVAVSGTFHINSYQLIFSVEGGMRFPKTLVYGAPVSAIAEPQKPHHTFSGWSEIPETMPAHDVTVTGHFTIEKFNLSMYLDGEVYCDRLVNYGTDLSTIPLPEKEGYTFSGWQDLPERMPDHDVVVNGRFLVNYYRLVYEVEGEMSFPRSVAYGSALKPLAEPTRLYHTFSGWSEIPETMPAHDVLVKGYFTVNSYPLSYVVDGEELWGTSIVWDTEVPSMDEPEKEGYTFSGWSEKPEKMPPEEVVISGTFSVNYYKLVYRLNGEVYYEEDVAYGDMVKLLADPEQHGYTFSGWGDVPVLMPAGDLTVDGTMTPNAHDLIFVLDGEEIFRETYRFGDLLPEKAEPEKEGYTFSGWSEIPATMPDGDVTVEGHFDVNYYNLVFSINDGEMTVPSSVAYGTPIFPIDSPAREFYQFSGWSVMPERMPAYDVTVVGTLRPLSFPLVCVLDGGVWKQEMVPYETEPVLTEPEKTGYTFTGWSGVPASMPACEVTVTGELKPNPYVLTYAVAGEICLSETVLCDTPLDRLFMPEKEGYVFTGWKDVPPVMPAHDLILRGEFVKA